MPMSIIDTLLIDHELRDNLFMRKRLGIPQLLLDEQKKLTGHSR
jgi:hypothetical protein